MLFNKPPTQKEKQTQDLARGKTAVHGTAREYRNTLGDIIAFHSDSNSYDVTSTSCGSPENSGTQVLKDVPRKMNDLGDFSVLPAGTSVVINWDLGFPYIDGVLPRNKARGQVEADPIQGFSVTGGPTVSDEFLKTHDGVGYYRDPRQPTDLLEEDHLTMGADGNYLGILRGKYLILSGGADSRAKMEIFGEQNTVALTAETLKINTGFGYIEIANYEGRNNIRIRGGIDQLSESGGAEENWTFKLDIGEFGDYYNMEICDPEGGTKASCHIDANGRITWMSREGYDVISAGENPSHQNYAGDIVTKILGNVLENIKRDQFTSIDGSLEEEIGQNHSSVVGGDYTQNVGNDTSCVVNGSMFTRVVGGPAIKALPNAVISETQLVNGGLHVEVGNPTAGSNPSIPANMDFIVHNGAITIGKNPSILSVPELKTHVNLNTVLPNSVALGGTVSPLSGNPALFHAVKYEPLLGILNAMMAMFDGHIHIGPLPPITTFAGVGMLPTIAPQLPNAMSLRVVIGM
jgi:hypothetical protein